MRRTVKKIDKLTPRGRAVADSLESALKLQLNPREVPAGMWETPARVAALWAEMTAGYKQDPAEILGTTFSSEGYDELVLLKGISFHSLCEHHLLPFSGEAAVGYLPAEGRIVGLSKLARIVDCFARRFQVQERLTKQVAEALEKHLRPLGVAVVVQASHSCMTCRGVLKPGAEMVTSEMRGAFRDKPEARAEVLRLIG